MVSVALAVYNGEKYLPALLASLESQTYKPAELVVVDDGSVDKSVEIIEQFPLSFEKRIFKNEHNLGAVATFKKAAGLCKENAIAFCDQDDIWLPGKLKLLANELSKLPQTKPSIAFSDLSVIDDNEKIIAPSFLKQRKAKPDKFSFTDVLLGNMVTGCATLINSAMTKLFLQMPAKGVMMHDHWLALIGYSFGAHVFVDKPTVLFRSHTGSVTDKREATYLSNFASEVRDADSYLNKNIEQAKAFKNAYQSYLSTSDLSALDNFINIEKRSFWYKRMYRDSRSLLRRLK